ncbi:class F sortase [Streptomyces sp. B-S-A8]|uniref:Class F sortase n=1 Tax=Streptomyces solicavernae TaxID=3043614 RepID=A0ABT6RR78_9ACTN|nr:class F sortase [Streptomyces sp. B-S-A8]MDI3386945.1 class F sortase [Streptomyces sp. B-S-A8]
MSEARTSRSARLATVAAWLLLLVGLWLWGRELSILPGLPGTGDVSAAGVQLPPAHDPLPAARPRRVDIPAIGVRAPVVDRGLDQDRAIEPPPYDRPGAVGWYAGGTRPGAEGAALFVGHVDTASDPAVFYDLSALKQGQKVRVARADGSLAEFTVEDVQVIERDDFDAGKAYGERRAGRAELRLITCGGTFDPATGSYSSNVVVSAYLTGTGP